MTKPFSEVLAEMQAMHDKKSQDYGVQADPFANVRASEDFGIPGWLGTIVRLNDKITRIKSFAKNGSLANESLRDSLIDIAVYGAIAVALYDQQETKPRVSFGSMVGKALAKYEDARILHYYDKIAEAATTINNGNVEYRDLAKQSTDLTEAEEYGCDSDCEDCDCDKNSDDNCSDMTMTLEYAVEELCICGAGGADIDCEAHGYPNRNDGPEPCPAMYYHLGTDNACDLPLGHDGAHENWAVAGVQGTIPLQWAGKPEPVRAT
jgi:hypothetical protein